MHCVDLHSNGFVLATLRQQSKTLKIMTKAQYIRRVRNELERIERSSVLPLEASDILMRVARSVTREHTRYGKLRKWDASHHETNQQQQKQKETNE